MARKKKHEDHVNHEAWAIPYGDLLTLLLAFFVVMYAVSSVNEGRYRVLADSMSQAFGGPPKAMRPIQLGSRPEKGTQSDAVFNSPKMMGFEQEASRLQEQRSGVRVPNRSDAPSDHKKTGGGPAAALQQMSDAVQQAMQELIGEGLVTVRRTDYWLQIDIRADILFASGASQLSPQALPPLRKLAAALQPFPNAVRIEGYTDNRPIATSLFPSNWELSAARAASVVHLFMDSGLDPARMSVTGFGEYRPVGDNATVDGRNRNRRVLIVVMAEGEAQAAELKNDLGDAGDARPAVVPAAAGAVPAEATP